jgi:hypothetical protein
MASPPPSDIAERRLASGAARAEAAYALHMGQSYGEYVQDVRRLGVLDLVEFSQPPGRYPDPAMDVCSLQVPVAGTNGYCMEFGGQRMSGASGLGACFLTPAHTHCDFQLDSDHHVVGIGMPASVMTEALRDLDPSFRGDFGALHDAAWRDCRVIDEALRLMRLARRRPAPVEVDADAAALGLAAMLLRRPRAAPCSISSNRTWARTWD